MSRNKVSYEWAIELIDAEYQFDILENEFADKLVEFDLEHLRNACLQIKNDATGQLYRLSLAKRYGNSDDGVCDSAHAYVEYNFDGGVVLEPEFTSGDKVPKRFFAELAAIWKEPKGYTMKRLIVKQPKKQNRRRCKSLESLFRFDCIE